MGQAAWTDPGVAGVSGWALVLAFSSAFGYAVAAAFQHHEAAGAPPSRRGWRLLAHLASRPRWLAGMVATACGAGLHVAALRLGPLALVQPVGVTGLVFALPLGALLHRRRVSRDQLSAAVMVAAGLAGLLASVRVSTAVPHISEPSTGLVAACLAAATAACLGAGRLLRGPGRAVVLGIGAGLAFGVTSALVQVVAHRVGAVGVAAALTSWTSAVLVGAAATGLMLSQNAYQAGSLGAVLPVLVVIDPVVAISVGEWLLGEPVRFSSLGAATAVACALVITAAAVRLARHHPYPVLTPPDEPGPPDPSRKNSNACAS